MPPRFVSPTPKRLPTAEYKQYLSEEFSFDCTSIDIPGQCAFSGGEVVLIQRDNTKVGVLLKGFRGYNSTQPYPGYVAKGRVLRLGKDLNFEGKCYEKHRSKAFYTANPSLFTVDRELFSTDDYVVLTDRQLLRGKKIMVLEDVRLYDVLARSHRSREFDCFLTLLGHDKIDLSEWFYINASAKKKEGSDSWAMGPLPVLENTTLRSSGSFAPVTYQDYMLSWMIIQKLVLSLHDPNNDSHRQMSKSTWVDVENVYRDPETGETFSEVLSIRGQEPGKLKPVTATLPVHAARDVLVSFWGEPVVKSGSQHIWRWSSDLVGDISSAAKCLGKGFNKMQFGDLPGKPISLITEQMFADTFEVVYNARTN